MKLRNIIVALVLCFGATMGYAQKENAYTDDDVKQFYRTIVGDYYGYVDSTALMIHFVPIWEQEHFKWMYLEVTDSIGKEIYMQKVVEVYPVTGEHFKLVFHGLKGAERFEGKWRNRNFFDGFNTSILKGKCKFGFMKTKDFEYQTNFKGRKKLHCFPKGDRVHFKFVQGNECLYVKRLPRKQQEPASYVFHKEPTD